METIKERIETAKLRARIFQDALGKCGCHSEQIEFAQILTDPAAIPDQIIKNALDRADQIQSAWIDKIRGLANSCRDMGEFRDRLIGVFGEMDTDKMADIMAQTTFLANMAGRAEVLDEVDG